jgi:tetratricopeptide (TPR) repeat protein
MEIAEVMASELSELLYYDKKRSTTKQNHLVLVLRDLASIHEIRGKWAQSIAAGSQLNKERGKLVSMYRKDGDKAAAVAIQEQAASDEIQRGRARMNQGSLRKALSHFAKARKLAPGNIEASARRIEAREKVSGTLGRANKDAIKLGKVLEKAGPVSRIGEVFQLQPEGEESHPVAALLEDISRWLSDEMALPAKGAASLIQCKKEIERQITAIEAGEQAANARLQAAIESLEPVVDYHTYSTGGTSQ